MFESSLRAVKQTIAGEVVAKLKNVAQCAKASSHGNRLEEDGYRAAYQFFALPLEQRPTALFVVNNESTAGVVCALRELGLSIPTDVSLVGFDDSRWARLMNPPLTVIQQPTYELTGLSGGEDALSQHRAKAGEPFYPALATALAGAGLDRPRRDIVRGVGMRSPKTGRQSFANPEVTPHPYAYSRRAVVVAEERG